MNESPVPNETTTAGSEIPPADVPKKPKKPKQLTGRNRHKTDITRDASGKFITTDGRPCALDQVIHDIIIANAKNGLGIADCAARAGIHRVSLRNWLTVGEWLYCKREQIECPFESDDLKNRKEPLSKEGKERDRRFIELFLDFQKAEAHYIESMLVNLNSAAVGVNGRGPDGYLALKVLSLLRKERWQDAIAAKEKSAATETTGTQTVLYMPIEVPLIDGVDTPPKLETDATTPPSETIDKAV